MTAWLAKAWKWIALALGVLVAVAVPAAGWAWERRKRAEADRDRARLQANLEAAHEASEVQRIALDRERELAFDLEADLAAIELDGQLRAEDIEAERESIVTDDALQAWRQAFEAKR